MSNEELEKLHRQAERYVETSGHAVREVIYPQLEGFKKSYNDYFKELATASGVIAGAVTALLSSSISKIEWLAILGFILLITVVIFTFVFFKNGLIKSVPYVQYLKELSRELTDFSSNAVRFSRGEISSTDFQTKEQEFKSNYDKWRNDQSAGAVNLNESKNLSKMSKWNSEINILFFTFTLGIVCVTLSIVVPLLCKR